MEKIPCSVPLLTLNAKRHMEQLLPFLTSQIEDVFLVDGNSTDGTLDVARSFGVRVEKQKDTNLPNQRIADFTQVRLRSWEFARYPWMMYLDADEVPSPEMMESIRYIVHENDSLKAHRFRRLVRLPDGRVVQHAFFYPDQSVIRLFHGSSGITLTPGRKVHERFSVPQGVQIIDHPEIFTNEWPTPIAFRKKSQYYLSLETGSIAPTWSALWRWVVWYNLRSFIGQTVRSIMVWFRGRSKGELVLPWSYTLTLLAYRWIAIGHGIQTWVTQRRQHHS